MSSVRYVRNQRCLLKIPPSVKKRVHARFMITWLCHILSRNKKKKKGMVYSILLYTSLFSSDCVKTLCFRRTDHVFCWRVTDLYICAQNQQSDSKRKFSLLKMSKIIIHFFGNLRKKNVQIDYFCIWIYKFHISELIISVFEFFLICYSK